MEPLVAERFRNEEKYRDGHIRIINPLPGREIWGLHIPDMRKLARELAAREAVNAGTTSYKTVKTIAETVDPTGGHHLETDDESSFILTHADGREVR